MIWEVGDMTTVDSCIEMYCEKVLMECILWIRYFVFDIGAVPSPSHSCGR